MIRLLAFIILVYCFLPGVPVEAATVTLPPSSLNLIGYWSFNEGVGTMAGDASGSGNHGTLTNMDAATDWVTGRLGRALDFDGSNDYVELGTVPASEFTNTQGWALSVWVYPTKASGLNAIITRALNGGRGWYLQHDNGTVVTRGVIFDYWDGSAFIRIRSQNDDVPLNQWTHLTLVKIPGSNSVNNYSIYVNGMDRTTRLTAGNPSTINYAGTSLQIGARGGAALFGGKLDEARLYGRALASGEVTRLYQAGAAKQGVSRSTGSLADGLTGWWTFDGKDMWGGVARDRSGSGNDGALVNIATSTFYTEGVSGQAVNFDGSNDYVRIADADSLDVGQDASASFSVWYYSRNGTSNNTILAKRSTDLSGNTDYIFFTGSNQLTFGTGSSADTCAWLTVTEPAKGQWHHIVGVLSPTGAQTGTKSLYIDGTLSTSCSYSVKTAANTSPLYLGKFNGSGSYWSGGIDDFRIYNRVLSPEEVKRLQLLGTPSKAAATATAKGSLADGLVSHWTFDGKDMWGGVARDRSGNGHDGQLFNIASSTFYTAGVSGQAANFDGSNDYAQTPAHTELNGATSLTITGWVRRNSAASRGGIFTRWTSASNWLGIQFFTTNDVNLIVSNGATAYGKFEGPDDGMWHHYALVYDGSQSGNASRLKGYLDGVPQTLAFTNAIPATAPTMTGNDRVGYDTHNGISLDGALDDVRVYARALTPAEVQALSRQSRP